MTTNYDSMVVLTTGKQDRGARATLAFSWACSALALGKKTAIFLTMDGTVWSLQGFADGVQVDGFEPLSCYVESFLSMGGKMFVCAPCTEYYCGQTSGNRSERFVEEAQIAGLTTVVSSADRNCQLVTF